MFSGAHIIIYSKYAEADRAFFRDVLGFFALDIGEGWLLFALPPSEAAFHPADGGGTHELYLMCDDVEAVVKALRAKGATCTDPTDQGWGVLTAVKLPGGSDLGIYQPRHPVAHGAGPE